MEDIVIRNLCKSFAGKPVLRDFSAVLPVGQVTGLMAPSGAGKTTLLRILMGLERPDGGTIDGLAGLRLSAGFQARELSGGMRRRVAILRALLAEYDLLFLDEPFKGLDRETKETVMADTRRRCAGRTVLLVTHDVAELDAMGAVVRLDLST